MNREDCDLYEYLTLFFNPYQKVFHKADIKNSLENPYYQKNFSYISSNATSIETEWISESELKEQQKLNDDNESKNMQKLKKS